jgi:hypothetical protein
MRIIRPPSEIIGNNLVQVWRQSSELRRRFPDTEEGCHAFIDFIGKAIAQQLEKERGEPC